MKKRIMFIILFVTLNKCTIYIYIYLYIKTLLLVFNYHPSQWIEFPLLIARLPIYIDLVVSWSNKLLSIQDNHFLKKIELQNINENKIYTTNIIEHLCLPK